MSSGGNMSNGSRQNKRPAPLKTAKDEVRQYRPPVIIHTYSPTIVHVDAAKFSSLVQSLTGRGQKRKPEASPRVREFTTAGEEFSGNPGVLSGQLGLISPRGPLTSFDHLFPQFDASSAPSQSITSDQSTRSVLAMNGFAAAAASAASAGGPQYSPLFSNSPFSNSFPHLFSPIPSPNLLSPNFMADLPALSPSTYQAFDVFGAHSFVTSPDYGAKFSAAGILPSPGSYSAYKDMAWMMSRD